MRKRVVRLAPVLLLLVLVPMVLVAHPHFFRTSAIKVTQTDEMVLSHATVPYNEAHPSQMEAGTTWGIPGGKLVTPVALKSGETKIPAGEYQLKVKKASDKAYSLELAQGEKSFPLKSKFSEGHFDQEHLVIDLHMRGTGEELAGYIDLRFGTYLIAGKINIDRESAEE